MKSRYPFLSGIAFGLILSCIIDLIDSTIDFDSVATIVLGMIIFFIVILLDHCDNHKN